MFVCLHDKKAHIYAKFVRKYRSISSCRLKKEDTAHMLTETSSRGRELAVLQEMKSRLERDLRNILTNRGVDASNYAETMEFLDPVTNIRGRSEYLIAIQALRVALQPEVNFSPNIMPAHC